ncbi:MAG TPA: HAMP domain-containing sensor histidine kinase [Vicinamibacteria bacterium]|nr:HAMP domain-containing sensor histidine kinase [Vicinamibacteria bacterium]
MRSLRTRLAAVLATLVALLLLANAAWLVLSARQRMRERVETSASLFASLATGPICSAYDAYFESGYFKFRQVVRDLLAEAPDVTRAEIVDVEGHVRFDSSRLDEGAPAGVSADRVDAARLQAVRRLELTTLRGSDDNGATLEIVSPWVEDWGRHRLSVVYHVSYAKVHDEYARYARATLALTGVSILAAVLVGLALARRLTRPLAGLTEGAREIAQGRFGRRLDVRTGDELQTVAEAFNDMAERLEANRAERERLIDELERRNAELERFTYTVSHDLRSPLVTVRGFVDLLEKDVAALEPERVAGDLSRIRSATGTMEKLLRELLELSRVGRVMNPPETVSLDELARQAVAALHGRLRAAHVRVDVLPGLPSVHGDRTRLLEVLQNLIENAVKFRSGQGEPLVEVGSRPGPDGPVVYVRDNGVGIDPRYHDRVFALFERLDPRVEGTGVGLALVKRIVEVHGGRVWVESEGAGRGATFCFTIPAVP